MGDSTKVFLALSIVVVLFAIVYMQVTEEFATSNPKLDELHKVLLQLEPEVARNITLYEGDKSFTVNKEKMTLCLKEPGTNNYYDDNTLIYVAIHELAHAANPYDVGHTKHFYDKFDELLKRAERMGLYNPNKPMPDNYCNYKKGVH